MKPQTNRNVNINQSNQGFTLVELVVVILILGILAATALPKFMNVSAEAHSAAVAGAGGGLGAGVALAHAQWVAKGSGTTAAFIDNVQGFGNNDVDVSTIGWPTDTAGANSIAAGAVAQCQSVWTGVMQNPPTVTGATSDYTVTSPAADQCLYTYRADTAKTITYDSSTGSVTVVN